MACSWLCTSTLFSVNDSDIWGDQGSVTNFLNFAFIWIVRTKIHLDPVGCVTLDDNLKNKNIKIDYYKGSAQFELIKASKIKIDNLTLNFCGVIGPVFFSNFKV